MRWRTQQVGDKRTRVFLALLPEQLDDGTTVWLERVEVVEVLAGPYDDQCWQRISCRLASVTGARP